MKKSFWLAVYKNIRNTEALKKYAVKATEAIKNNKGTFIVRGGRAICLEGDELSPRTVLVEFPSFLDAENCYKSKEYQEALEILKGAADRQVQIIEGV